MPHQLAASRLGPGRALRFVPAHAAPHLVVHRSFKEASQLFFNLGIALGTVKQCPHTSDQAPQHFFPLPRAPQIRAARPTRRNAKNGDPELTRKRPLRIYSIRSTFLHPCTAPASVSSAPTSRPPPPPKS